MSSNCSPMSEALLSLATGGIRILRAFNASIKERSAMVDKRLIQYVDQDVCDAGISNSSLFLTSVNTERKYPNVRYKFTALLN